MNHFLISAFIFTDPSWQIDCCGVITGWTFKTASSAGQASMSVWEGVDVSSFFFKMTDENVFSCECPSTIPMHNDYT